jgi:hypothetical protein
MDQLSDRQQETIRGVYRTYCDEIALINTMHPDTPSRPGTLENFAQRYLARLGTDDQTRPAVPGAAVHQGATPNLGMHVYSLPFEIN